MSGESLPSGVLKVAEECKRLAREHAYLERTVCNGAEAMRSHLIRDKLYAAIDQLAALASPPPQATGALSEDPETLARRFHEAYERLAPKFGYQTQPSTKDFDPATANGRLMIATCAEVLAALSSAKREAEPQWLPIESAPRDGTEVLLWRDDCGQFIGSNTTADAFPLEQKELDELTEEELSCRDWFSSGLTRDGSKAPRCQRSGNPCPPILQEKPTMTDTTQPHPEPSEEASSLPVYAFHLLWPDDANGIAWNEWYEADDEMRPTEWDDDASPEECIAVVRLSDAQSQLNAMRAERDDALQKYHEWHVEALCRSTELDALKAAPVVDVEAIMRLAEQYARAHTLDERVTFEHMGTSAEEAAEKAMNAARDALRASLVAHKAGNVSDNGTSDQSVSHNVRAAATMAQTKETP